MVAVEALVLGRHHRLAQDRWDRSGADRLPGSSAELALDTGREHRRRRAGNPSRSTDGDERNREQDKHGGEPAQPSRPQETVQPRQRLDLALTRGLGGGRAHLEMDGHDADEADDAEQAQVGHREVAARRAALTAAERVAARAGGRAAATVRIAFDVGSAACSRPSPGRRSVVSVRDTSNYWLGALSVDPLDDEHVPRGVDAVREHPVDNPPWAGAVRQMQDLADLRFMHGMHGAEAAHDLRRVELADLAFPDAPNNAAHRPQVGTRELARGEGFCITEAGQLESATDDRVTSTDGRRAAGEAAKYAARCG